MPVSLLELPKELILTIILNLDVRSILNFGQTSKTAKSISEGNVNFWDTLAKDTNDDKVWQYLVRRDFGKDVTINSTTLIGSKEKTWKDYYKKNAEKLVEFKKLLDEVKSYAQANETIPKATQDKLNAMLEQATKSGHSVWLEEAAKCGVDLTKVYTVANLLDLSTRWGCTHCATLILEKAGPQAKELIYQKDTWKNSNALAYVGMVPNDDPELLNKFLQICGFDLINQKIHQNRTLLHHAASNGNIKCVKFLLEHGADPTILGTISKDGKKFQEVTALDIAKDKDYTNPNTKACIEILEKAVASKEQSSNLQQLKKV